MSHLAEALLVESRRDQSHAFKRGADPEVCAKCGGRRWRHFDDGHRYTLSPWPTPEQMQFCHKTNYRAHPGWTKPGTERNRKVTV